MAPLKKDTVYCSIRDMIFTGEYKPGDKLPSEPELSHTLSVARVTLRSALKRLESEGWLTRTRSGGTVINCPSELRPRILLITRVEEELRPEVNIFYMIPGIIASCKDRGIAVGPESWTSGISGKDS